MSESWICQICIHEATGLSFNVCAWFFFFFTYMWGWQCNPTELWRKLKIIIFDTWGKISIPHMEFPFPLWNKLITCWFWFCSALPSLRFHSYKISRTSLFLDNKSNIFWVLAYTRHCYLPVVRKKRNNKTNKNTLMWYVIFHYYFTVEEIETKKGRKLAQGIIVSKRQTWDSTKKTCHRI